MYDNIYVQTSRDELRAFVCVFSLAMRHTNERVLQVYGCVYICDYMYIHTTGASHEHLYVSSPSR